MGKNDSPKEWTDPGQLTEEQIKKIMEPISEAPPAAVEVEPEQAETPPSAPERNEHDQMVEGVVQLLRGVYRTRNNGQEPDAKYVDRMRGMYENLSDEHLRQAVDVLTKEGESLKEAA